MFAGTIQYCDSCREPLDRPVFQLKEMSVIVEKIRIPKFLCLPCMTNRVKDNDRHHRYGAGDARGKHASADLEALAKQRFSVMVGLPGSQRCDECQHQERYHGAAGCGSPPESGPGDRGACQCAKFVPEGGT